MKAYALNRIERRGEDGKTEPVLPKTVFDVTATEFKRLESLGAARKPTDDELAIAKDNAKRLGNDLVEDGDEGDTDTAEASDKKQPDSGAAGDPNGKPKGAKVKGAGGDLDV